MMLSHHEDRRFERALLAADEGLRAERNDHVERPPDIRTEECRGDDADDGERHPLDGEALADDVGSSAKAPLPEAVADHGDRTVGAAASPVVRRLQGASENRGDAQHLEILAADPDTIHQIGLSALRQVEPRGGPGEGAVEGLRAVANRFPDGIGPGRPGRAHRSLADHHEPLRFRHRQRSEQQAVEDGEYRRVRANPQRQRQNRNSGGDWRSLQRTERVPDIVHICPSTGMMP
jgi:hypothetical protein